MDRMTQLARLFPTLDRADGIDPFDPELLDTWAMSGAPSHGGVYAAQFLLAVYSGTMGNVKRSKTYKDVQGLPFEYGFSLKTPWKIGPFDIVAALTTWDDVHRAAFLTWAKEPWWP